MHPVMRMRLHIARTSEHSKIVGITAAVQLGIATVVGLGVTGVDLPLAVLTIAITAFGALGGGAAIEDIIMLRDDMDPGTADTTYGRNVRKRNLGLLRKLTMGLLGLTGLALLIAIFRV